MQKKVLFQQANKYRNTGNKNVKEEKIAHLRSHYYPNSNDNSCQYYSSTTQENAVISKKTAEKQQAKPSKQSKLSKWSNNPKQIESRSKKDANHKIQNSDGFGNTYQSQQKYIEQKRKHQIVKKANPKILCSEQQQQQDFRFKRVLTFQTSKGDHNSHNNNAYQNSDDIDSNNDVDFHNKDDDQTIGVGLEKGSSQNNQKSKGQKQGEHHKRLEQHSSSKCHYLNDSKQQNEDIDQQPTQRINCHHRQKQPKILHGHISTIVDDNPYQQQQKQYVVLSKKKNTSKKQQRQKKQQRLRLRVHSKTGSQSSLPSASSASSLVNVGVGHAMICSRSQRIIQHPYQPNAKAIGCIVNRDQLVLNKLNLGLALGSSQKCIQRKQQCERQQTQSKREAQKDETTKPKDKRRNHNKKSPKLQYRASLSHNYAKASHASPSRPSYEGKHEKQLFKRFSQNPNDNPNSTSSQVQPYYDDNEGFQHQESLQQDLELQQNLNKNYEKERGEISNQNKKNFKKASSNNPNPTQSCELHPEQPIIYYCLQCRAMICSECALHSDIHKPHSDQIHTLKKTKIKLKEIAHALSAQIDYCQLSGHKECKDFSMEQIGQIKAKISKQKQRVKNTFELFIRNVQNKYFQVIRKLEENQEKLIQPFAERLEEYQVSRKRYDQIKGRLLQAFQFDKDSQHFDDEDRDQSDHDSNNKINTTITISTEKYVPFCKKNQKLTAESASKSTKNISISDDNTTKRQIKSSDDDYDIKAMHLQIIKYQQEIKAGARRNYSKRGQLNKVSLNQGNANNQIKGKSATTPTQSHENEKNRSSFGMTSQSSSFLKNSQHSQYQNHPAMLTTISRIGAVVGTIPTQQMQQSLKFSDTSLLLDRSPLKSVQGGIYQVSGGSNQNCMTNPFIIKSNGSMMMQIQQCQQYESQQQSINLIIEKDPQPSTNSMMLTLSGNERRKQHMQVAEEQVNQETLNEIAFVDTIVESVKEIEEIIKELKVEYRLRSLGNNKTSMNQMVSYNNQNDYVENQENQENLMNCST